MPKNNSLEHKGRMNVSSEGLKNAERTNNFLGKNDDLIHYTLGPMTRIPSTKSEMSERITKPHKLLLCNIRANEKSVLITFLLSRNNKHKTKWMGQNLNQVLNLRHLLRSSFGYYTISNVKIYTWNKTCIFWKNKCD